MSPTLFFYDIFYVDNIFVLWYLCMVIVYGGLYKTSMSIFGY